MWAKACCRSATTRARPSRIPRASRPRSTAGIGFAQFVEEYLAPDPRPARAALGRQSGFLDPGKGAGVDLLFRYEALDALVKHENIQL